MYRTVLDLRTSESNGRNCLRDDTDGSMMLNFGFNCLCSSPLFHDVRVTALRYARSLAPYTFDAFALRVFSRPEVRVQFENLCENTRLPRSTLGRVARSSECERERSKVHKVVAINTDRLEERDCARILR